MESDIMLLLLQLEEEIKTLKDNLQKAEHQRNTLEQDCLKLREQLKDLMHVKQVGVETIPLLRRLCISHIFSTELE